MFGNEENDGFLDGLLKYASRLGAAALLVISLAFIYDDFTRAWKNRNYKKLFMYFATVCSIIIYSNYIDSEREKKRVGIDYSKVEWPTSADQQPSSNNEPDWLKNERYW